MIRHSECRLFISSHASVEIADVYGTPAYVYDEDTIYSRAMEIRSFADSLGIDVYYSVKANFNPYIVSTIVSMGFGLETVSPGEILLATRIGMDPSKVMFTGNSVSIQDLQAAVRFGAKINVDSVSAAKKLCRLGYKGRVGVRINPLFGAGHHQYTVTGGIRSKFGVPISQLNDVYEVLNSCGIVVERLHAHLGSGINATEPYLRLFSILVELARKKGGVEEIDIGGGFAVPYRDEKERFPWKKFGDELKSIISELSAENYKVIIEPGRYLVAESGVLLTSITDLRKVGDMLVIGTDTGMNHLIRPPLYNAYHRVFLAENYCGRKPVRADIVGNVCESSDYLAKNIVLPEPKEGEILAVMDVGAYGMAMSSNYNLRERPPEVLVKRDSSLVLTRPRESVEEFLGSYVGFST